MNSLETLAQLTTLYQQPHRFYHNLEHIHRCLRQMRLVKFESGEIPEEFHEQSMNLLEIAIWFHDAYYIVGLPPGHNEENSAMLCESVLKDHNLYSEWEINCICRMIEATAEHEDDLTSNVKYNLQKYLLDIDIASMGSTEEQFFIDSENIIKEYLTIPELCREDIVAGRIKFLENFSDREYLFRTPEFRLKYEDNARHNINKWCSWAKAEIGEF